jgi:hypothetical protein
MKMAMVPTKDDAVWFGVGYIAARAGVVNIDSSPPFHENRSCEWMRRSYMDGLKMGYEVYKNRIPVPEFETPETLVAITLVTMQKAGPQDVAILLWNWCQRQNFIPLPMRDGRQEAFNEILAKDLAENPKDTDMISGDDVKGKLMQLLKKMRSELGINADMKLAKMNPDGTFTVQDEKSDDDSESVSSDHMEKLKRILN